MNAIMMMIHRNDSARPFDWLFEPSYFRLMPNHHDHVLLLFCSQAAFSGPTKANPFQLVGSFLFCYSAILAEFSSACRAKYFYFYLDSLRYERQNRHMISWYWDNYNWSDDDSGFCAKIFRRIREILMCVWAKSYIFGFEELKNRHKRDFVGNSSFAVFTYWQNDAWSYL